MADFTIWIKLAVFDMGMDYLERRQGCLEILIFLDRDSESWRLLAVNIGYNDRNKQIVEGGRKQDAKSFGSDSRNFRDPRKNPQRWLVSRHHNEEPVFRELYCWSYQNLL